jgi:hypothetical protein
MAAFPNPFAALKNAFTPKSTGAKIVPINQGVAPVSINGQKLTPHEFLEAQILNLPDEEESAQKRLLLAIAYFAATWGGSALMIVLGVGLATDLQTIVQVSGMFAFALTLLFPFAEFCFEVLAILVGERIHQGLRTRGDWSFVLVFAPLVLVANISTAMLQVFLLQHAAAAAAVGQVVKPNPFEDAVLWFRAFLPLAIVISTIGICAGIQRRSLSHMIKAIERKTEGINKVAEASVKYMESEESTKRLVDEHEDLKAMRAKKDEAASMFYDMMKKALDEKMDKLKELEDKDRNGRNGRSY